MQENRPSRFHVATALSVVAGFFGVAVVDTLAVVFRGRSAGFPQTLALALGLYGTMGLLAAALAGWAVAVVMRSIPGGPAAVRDDEGLDARVCGLLLGGVAAGAVLAVGAGVGYAGFVSSMNSRTLATIASAGLGALCLLPATLVLLAVAPLGARLAQRLLPRPPALGRAGLLVLLLAAAGVLAFVAALSRSDWRVLDLGPFAALAIAIVLGAGHGLFWHRSQVGRQLLQKLPVRAIRLGAAILVVVLLIVGSQIS